jgi:hypothetical protein
MANPELVRTLDFILNHCDDQEIDAVAQAVVRRRRELSMFGGEQNLPDPQRMARELSGQINAGASIDGLKQTVLDMAIRIIRQEAPELTDEQIKELTDAWVPGSESDDPGVPPEMLRSMIEQFIAFSRGTMSIEENKGLRSEVGSWPEKYWHSFPQVIRLIVTDYLKDRISEKEFNSQISTALAI